MGAMHRRRPKRDAWKQRFLGEIERLDLIRGRCRIVDQKALVFGAEARSARQGRPAVILKVDGERVLVVPGTSRNRSDYFLLNRGHCPQPRDGQARGLDRTTYLPPDIEIVPCWSLWTFLCDLNEPTRKLLLQWLKEQLWSNRVMVEQRLGDSFTA